MRSWPSWSAAAGCSLDGAALDVEALVRETAPPEDVNSAIDELVPPRAAAFGRLAAAILIARAAGQPSIKSRTRRVSHG